MQAVERVFLGNNWVTLVLIFAFVLLFVMKVFKPNRLYGYSIAFFVKGFFEKRAEEKPEVLSLFYSLLFTFSTIVISLFVVFVVEEFTNKNLRFYNFCFIVLFITSLLVLRFIIDLFITNILNLKEIIRYFLFSKVGYLYSLCLLLSPILVIYLYGFKNTYFLIGSFTILFSIRSLLLVNNNKKLILNNLFYFILYLCTLEIAPLFILYKVLTK